MAFKAVNNFGLDAELARRMNEKYDKNLEDKIQTWIQTVTGIAFDKPFGEMLQSGIVLCELVNALMPGRIKKINKTGGLFRMQENITNFIRVCREVGVPEASLFPTESLAQLKDLNQVLTTINSFSMQVQRRKAELGVTYDGPFLGPPPTKAATSFKKNDSGSPAPSSKPKSKWVVKPGGSAGVSLLNQGSAGIMEQSKYVDPREQIKRNQLDGKGSTNEVSGWSKGSAGMERLKYTDAREQIKRNELDGKGTEGEVSALNQGSAGMERQQYTDAREQIKRGQL